MNRCKLFSMGWYEAKLERGENLSYGDLARYGQMRFLSNNPVPPSDSQFEGYTTYEMSRYDLVDLVQELQNKIDLLEKKV